MVLRATLIWIVGLLTLVPYAGYYLFFEAPRDQYALLIVGILFWIFGYWGVVGPLLAAIKVRQVFRVIEMAKSREDVVAALRSPETQDAFIEMIASENKIPKFLARKVFALAVEHLSELEQKKK